MLKDAECFVGRVSAPSAGRPLLCCNILKTVSRGILRPDAKMLPQVILCLLKKKKKPFSEITFKYILSHELSLIFQACSTETCNESFEE